MATWRVGKTVVGYGKPTADIPAQTERRAKYKMGQLMRETVQVYRVVAAPGDPNGWAKPLWELEQMAEALENGGAWPDLGHGYNWLWSLPWGSDGASERDLVVFWAKAEAEGEGGGAGEPLVVDSPSGGAKRELVGSGQAA